MVRITNTGQSSLFARYNLGDPDWTTISGFNLHPVGDSFCGTTSHSDPDAYTEVLAPGATLEFGWNGEHYESRSLSAGPCWQLVYADPGSYPAEVCVLTQNIPLTPIAQVDAGPVTVCTPTALDLPASGETVINVSFPP